MLVLIHVGVALTSVLLTTLLWWSPSKLKYQLVYGSISLTLISGTYLVIRSHAQLLQACTSGLVYIGLVSLGVVLAHRKQHAKQRIK